MSSTRKRNMASSSAASDGFNKNTKEKSKDLRLNGEGLQGDYGNIALLLFLYMLQGVPIGLSQTMDLILQEKSITYEEQGVFGSVSWPYSLKLLWAPIVDAVYSRTFGRRKTWLVPTQFLLGALMLIVPNHIDNMLGEGDSDARPDVNGLTALFFTFYLLAATQDIALDGWAVTMLAPRNRGWASTCNAIGQTTGFFLSFTGFLGLKTYDLATLGSFMQFWGAVFVITTALVWLFKREVDEEEEDMTVREAYGQMYQVLKLRGVQLLLILLFTRGIAFAATDNLAQRKLVEKGMKKEHVAGLMVLVTPLSIILPGIISKQTTDKPLLLLRKAYLPRVLLGVLSLCLVAFAPDFHAYDSLPMTFFGCLVVFVVVHATLSTAMFVSMMAFFAQVSDPAIGGTYMTLLNTIANLGVKWPNQVVLFLVDILTIKSCPGIEGNTCGSKDLMDACEAAGSTCQVDLDGFYVLAIGGVIVGLVWYKLCYELIERLQNAPISSWRVSIANRSRTD